MKKSSIGEKVQRVRQIIREIEGEHPREEYSGKRNRFPNNINLEALVEAVPLTTIERNLRAIDKAAPWKYASISGREEGSTSTTECKQYHLLIQHAPRLLPLLNTAAAKRKGRGDSYFDRDENVLNVLASQIETYGIKNVDSFTRQALHTGCLPRGFWSTVDMIMKNVSAAKNEHYLEERLVAAQKEYQKRVEEVKGRSEGDYWSRSRDDEPEQRETLEKVAAKWRKKEGEIKQRASYYSSIRSQPWLQEMSLGSVVDSLTDLYRCFAAEEVNNALGGWEAKRIRNSEFGLEVPVFFEIPFPTYVQKLQKAAKTKVSPHTYAEVMISFRNDFRSYGFSSEQKEQRFEQDLFRFFRAAQQVNKKPDRYVRHALLANREHKRSLPQTIGYKATKEFAILAAKYSVDPEIIPLFVKQYGGSYSLSGSEKEENKNPSRLELLQRQQPGKTILEIVEPLFAFDQRSRKAGMKVKEYGDKWKEAQPLAYILDEDNWRLLEEVGSERFIQLSDALLKTGTPLQTFLGERYGRVQFYLNQFKEGNVEELVALVQEVGKEQYATWDKETLLQKSIPRSQRVIQEVGLDQFLENIRYCVEQEIDLPLALEWGLPTMEEALINDLREGEKTTKKERYQQALQALQRVEGAVPEQERVALVRELREKIVEERQGEVDKVNTYIREFDRVNKEITSHALDLKTIYGYLHKEKFATLAEFVERADEIVRELTELPAIIEARGQQRKSFDHFTAEEREQYQQRSLQRFRHLAELLGGEHDFDRLAAEVAQDFRGFVPFGGEWDHITNYASVLGTMFSFLPISEEEYQAIVQRTERYRRKEEQGRGFFSVRVEDPVTVGLATELRKRQVAKGITAAEIGGTVVPRVLGALGAETACADAGYNSTAAMFGPLMVMSGAIQSERQARSIPLEQPDQLVTLDHYTHKFSYRYDFTFTNKVFDNGSGVEAIAEGWGINATEAAIKELLAIFSNLTRLGGYSIHGGVEDFVSKPFLEYLGFVQVFEHGRGQRNVVILQKQEPQPELYPEGIQIGAKHIDYNSDAKEFYLKK